MSKTYTVVGVWMGDPVPVGVIEGNHSVVGGDDSAFEEGLWAVHVTADNAEDAERLAVEEMEAENGDDADEQNGESYTVHAEDLTLVVALVDTVHNDDNGVRCDLSGKPVPDWDSGSGGCPRGCAAGDTTDEMPEE